MKAASLIEIVDWERSRFGEDTQTVLQRLEASRDEWPAKLKTVPSLLFKGFPLGDDVSFAKFARALTQSVSRYVAGQTDRTEVSALVYEATKIPGLFPIHLHAEMAYSPIFPSHLFFYSRARRCLGGASWLASNAAIWDGLPRELQARLEGEGVRYVRLLPPRGARALLPFRALRSGALKSWQESLEVEDREGAERVLRARGLPFAWLDDGWLDLSSRQPAFRVDPLTGQQLWFNQCHTMQVNPFLHGHLVTWLFRAANWFLGRAPFGATFGDGTPFSDDDFRAIRGAHDAARVERVLEQGDVLYFDNLRLSHGRGPYLGQRQVRVVFCGLDSSLTGASP